MDNDNERDPGQVFAIPDLYAPSGLLKDVHWSCDLLFSQLTLDGEVPVSVLRLSLMLL